MEPVVVRYRSDMSTARFSEELAAALNASKLVVSTGVDPAADPRRFWDEVSDTVGDCVLLAEDASGTKLGQKWMEIRYDDRVKNAYRHSDAAQPLHTDGSYITDAPDIIFFYCLSQASAGGETTFVDSVDLLETLDRRDGGLLADLRTTPVRFSKDQDSKARPIISGDGDGDVLTWNYFCLDPAEPEDVKRLVERFHAFLQHDVVGTRLVRDVRLRPGDAVFFHDERVLHGRNAFVATARNERFLWKTGFTLKKSPAQSAGSAAGTR